MKPLRAVLLSWKNKFSDRCESFAVEPQILLISARCLQFNCKERTNTYDSCSWTAKDEQIYMTFAVELQTIFISACYLQFNCKQYTNAHITYSWTAKTTQICVILAGELQQSCKNGQLLQANRKRYARPFHLISCSFCHRKTSEKRRLAWKRLRYSVFFRIFACGI